MPHHRTMLSLREEHLLFLCRVASFTGFALMLVWLFVYAVLQEWSLAQSEIILGLALLPCWRIAVKGFFPEGLMLSQFVFIAYIISFCLIFDVPQEGTQRSTHLYLIVIALVGYINLQRYRSLFQMAAIGISLVAFVIFSSSNLVFNFSQPMPKNIQVFSTWMNAIVSTLMLCGGIAVMHIDFSRRNEKTRSIQNALYNNEFVLFYQPIVNCCGELTGAEALIRWKSPERGMISPSEFIPCAQESGMMPVIGNWVITQAFRELAFWQTDPATKHITMSINITVDHFMQPDFVQKILHQSSIANIPSRKVKFEITESVFASDIDVVVEKMNALSNAGFRFSLDDFGTGFSSLSYLRRLPLEQIKIDRSFVAAATESSKGEVIAKNISRMGHELNIEVLAEGIETAEQWAMMLKFGCTTFQGFYFFTPLPADEFRRVSRKSMLVADRA
ncbi:diguanylate cyclase/phosphodiesterase [Pantoea sp. AS-PWVM4]|uniref:putative bifunctional diguanylate cyclase/phosphodiesterase n=1 Tax=Pantoea sp. AS-PWVM4 TaxID=1332069 RepID=UPI0003AC72C4|nr:EAL domain-containing protein [Pantoea sp. AS-PWVM4]ERK16285.1 diguanylate cyclase/phosphodiesterase [Pantoea sp. AS-PWVM4]